MTLTEIVRTQQAQHATCSPAQRAAAGAVAASSAGAVAAITVHPSTLWLYLAALLGYAAAVWPRRLADRPRRASEWIRISRTAEFWCSREGALWALALFAVLEALAALPCPPAWSA